MGDGALSSWQGCGPGERALDASSKAAASRPAAAPGARLGLSALSALGTSSCSMPPAAAAEDGGRARPRPSRSKCRTGAAAGRQLRRTRRAPTDLPTSWSRACDHRGAQHAGPRRHQFDHILADGSLGKGVEDVTIDRSEDNDASRLERATTATSAASAWSTSAA
jgi:hypothetical protein